MRVLILRKREPNWEGKPYLVSLGETLERCGYAVEQAESVEQNHKDIVLITFGVPDSKYAQLLLKLKTWEELKWIHFQQDSGERYGDKSGIRREAHFWALQKAQILGGWTKKHSENVLRVGRKITKIRRGVDLSRVWGGPTTKTSVILVPEIDEPTKAAYERYRDLGGEMTLKEWRTNHPPEELAQARILSLGCGMVSGYHDQEYALEAQANNTVWVSGYGDQTVGVAGGLRVRDSEDWAQEILRIERDKGRELDLLMEGALENAKEHEILYQENDLRRVLSQLEGKNATESVCEPEGQGEPPEKGVSLLSEGHAVREEWEV